MICSASPQVVAITSPQIVGARVKVLTQGSLYGALLFHRILFMIDNNWPYVMHLAQNNNYEIWPFWLYQDENGEPLTWDAVSGDLFYSYKNPGVITKEIITHVGEWVGKNLCFQDDTFKVTSVVFIPVQDTMDALAWFGAGYEHVPLRELTDPTELQDHLFSYGCMEADCSLETLEKYEDLVLDAVEDAAAEEDACIEDAIQIVLGQEPNEVKNESSL